MPLLEVREVTMAFGGLKAVSKFNLTVDTGQVVGIIGPNGAGKTTVFNVISGIYRPTHGRVLVEGRDVTGLRPFQVNKAGVARTFQNLRLFANLSVIDNVKVAFHQACGYGVGDALLWSRGFKKAEAEMEARARRLLEVFGLAEKADYYASSLPYGEQKRLEIARALASGPKLLLLDEPAAGMNPNEVGELVGLLGWVRAEFGVAILLIEHRMDVVMNFCEWVVAMDFGEAIAAGPPGEVQQNPRVVEAYLGRGDEVGTIRSRKLSGELRPREGTEGSLPQG